MSLITNLKLRVLYCGEVFIFFLVGKCSNFALAVVRPTGVYLFDFFCSGIQFYALISPMFALSPFLYLDLYVPGDNAWISYGSFMQTKHLCILIHI